MPVEATPAVEGVIYQDACTDLAQASDNVGMQTPPLDNQEVPVLTSSPVTDSGYAEAAPNRKQAGRKGTEIPDAAPARTQVS